MFHLKKIFKDSVFEKSRCRFSERYWAFSRSIIVVIQSVRFFLLKKARQSLNHLYTYVRSTAPYDTELFKSSFHFFSLFCAILIENEKVLLKNLLSYFLNTEKVPATT